MTKSPATSALPYATKVALLSGLLGLLALSAVLGLVFSPQAQSERRAQSPLLAGFEAAAVAKLELAGQVVLTKAPRWTLTVKGKAYPANAERIEGFLTSLAGLQRERLVASSGDPETYGLGAKAKTLKLFNATGAVVADLSVGNPTDQGNKVFVRLGGQNEIVQTDRTFARSLEQDFNTWADLALAPGRKGADLTRIAFDSKLEAPDKTAYAPFDLVRTTKDGKPTWENRLGGKGEPASLAAWAEASVSYRFGAYLGPDEAPPAGAPLGTLSLTWADGTQSQVKIGPVDSGGRYLGTDGVRQFWLNDWSLPQLLWK